ncbi:MAG: hypothetical protein PHH60_00495 [Candidatus Margulisbacteria bacterium]|nr:hypothetical protein [Candidatus Margulisiibacteriota bacterium]
MAMIDSQGIEKLVSLDLENAKVLDMIIDTSTCGLVGGSDVNLSQADLDAMSEDQLKDNGYIFYGEGTKRVEAALAGTGGVALVEEIKNCLQTQVANISTVIMNQAQMTKIAGQKLGT